MPLGVSIEYFRGSLAEEERSTLNVSQKTRSLGAVISKQNNKQTTTNCGKGESQLNTVIHLFQVYDCRSNVASCVMLVLSRLPHRDELCSLRL